MKRQEFYRGKFMIGVYASLLEGETLLALCDNVREFAKLMHIKESNARMILQNVYTGKIKHIVFKDRFREIQLIHIDEDYYK